MSLLRKVKKTVVYGNLFHYKRNLSEIYTWLITAKKHSLVEVKRMALALGVPKKDKTRKKRNQTAKEKIYYAQKKLQVLKNIFSIQFLGFTGSVSAKNAKKGDDIDILIVCSQNSLWLTRPVVLLYLQLLGLRRKRSTPKHLQANLICTNLWLTPKALKIPLSKRNLYTAHELLQVLPLFDKNNTYSTFISKNKWAKKYLFHAYTKKNQKLKKQKKNNLIDFYLWPLNALSFLVQYLAMYPLAKGEEVNLSSAYFHNRSYAKSVSKKYKTALRKI